MRIRTPGKIRENLWLLGTEESCLYLVEGEEGFLLINGGLSYLVPVLLRQFHEFGIDERRITKLLILHAHFDHVGVVPFFKRRHEQMEIYASQRGWAILQMPEAIQTMNDFGRKVTNRMTNEEVYTKYDLDWRNDVSGKVVREGDRIDLGDVEVSILEIPGHSSCSIAAYIPEMKVLFPSDGGGIPFKEMIIPSGTSNYTKFQTNLERLRTLEIEYFCADHYGYVAGEEARNYIPKAIEAAREHRDLMEKLYYEREDVKAVAEKLTSEFYAEYPDHFLPPDISALVYRQMIRNIVSENATEDRKKGSICKA